MSENITVIPLTNLSIIFIPVSLVVVILYRWSLEWKKSIYGIFRMVLQLLLIGYFLSYIFESKESLIIISTLCIMVFIASWIALGTISNERKSLFKYALISIVIGGGSILILVSQLVLKLDPWYLPQYMIPIAGMIFASSMNGVSLAGERLIAELNRENDYTTAKSIALRAALIPITNSLFAVGLVSLPGMMTGQILSGISPLIAVRYQVMVMCMIFSAVGLSSFLFLSMIQLKVKSKA